jgi:uncharacterized protein (DUF1501 family)
MKKQINRKAFLQQMAILSGGVGFGLGTVTGKAFGQIPSAHLAQVQQGKILIIIQLSGGNDGLNTIIPAEDDLYQKARPTIAIKKQDALKLDQGMYLHPSAVGLKKLYDKGEMSVAQNIGYPNPNRSHFRATDIWNSGSDAATVLEEGWAGRFLKTRYPDFPITFPKHPMAVQLGSVESLLFQSDQGGFSTVFEDPNLFYQLVSGTPSDTDLPPDALAGDELGFLKQIAAASLQYAGVIRDGATKGKNTVTYPSTNLGRQFGIVSKLITGGLTTPVYLLNIGGFDTHSNQLTQHANLWKTISDAVTTFQLDMGNQNLTDYINIMTFSEFGRRVNQNGTAGTDHGTAAPMLFIGKTVRGGMIGANPNFKALDSNGDLKFNYDYRQVYSTVLRDHLGLDNVRTQSIFNTTFERLPIFKNSPDALPEAIVVELVAPWPNPASGYTMVQYGVFEEAIIQLALYDLQGQALKIIDSGKRKVGSYSINLDLQGFSAGHYLLSLTSSRGGRVTHQLVIQ